MTDSATNALELPLYIVGEPVNTDDKLEVIYPYTGEVSGLVSQINWSQAQTAIEAALHGTSSTPAMTRYQRHEILLKARNCLASGPMNLRT